MMHPDRLALTKGHVPVHEEHHQRRSRSRSPSDRHRNRHRRERHDSENNRSRKWTPPPTRAQRHHASGWDLGPSGLPVPRVSGAQALAAALGGSDPGHFGSGAMPMMNSLAAQPQQRTDRQARRLYAGNLPPTTENDVMEFFNRAMQTALINHVPGNSVLSVYLNMEKRFAFVEFRTQEEATSALSLDGIMFGGFPLKVRRPSDYNAAAASGVPANIPALDVSRLGIISTQVPDGPGKVFCGGLPYEVTEPEIRELLEAYGKLSAFHLVRDKDSQQSKGYCFFQYQDINVTDEACKGLNDLPIGGRTLTVRRAYSKDGDSQQPAVDFNVAPDIASSMLTIPSIPTVDVNPPSSAIRLLEMVTADELQDDIDYSEILEDIESECAKFGKLQKVLMPRRGDEFPASAVGKVFVRFSSVQEATKARDAIGGRAFGSRIVVAQFYAEDKFDARVLE